MTNKEQIHHDLVVALDFVEQIIDNPELTEKIPEGTAITFVNEEDQKVEKQSKKIPVKKYVRVKRHFELL